MVLVINLKYGLKFQGFTFCQYWKLLGLKLVLFEIDQSAGPVAQVNFLKL